MNPVTVIGVVAIAIVSITSHEAAHGFVADRLGDPIGGPIGTASGPSLPATSGRGIRSFPPRGDPTQWLGRRRFLWSVLASLPGGQLPDNGL